MAALYELVQIKNDSSSEMEERKGGWGVKEKNIPDGSIELFSELKGLDNMNYMGYKILTDGALNEFKVVWLSTL